MTVIVTSVIVLGVVTLARGYDKFFTIGPCTTTVLTDASIDFKKVAQDNNGIWSYMMVPDTSKYQNLQSMSVDFDETSESGKYVMTVYEQQTGAQPQKRLPIVLHDSGSGHATLDAKLDGKDTQLKMSVLAYEPNQFIYYYLCSEYGGDIKQDYRFALAHDVLTKSQTDKITSIDKQYGFLGGLKTINKYKPPQ